MIRWGRPCCYHVDEALDFCKTHTKRFQTELIETVWIYYQSGSPTGACRQWMGRYSIHLTPGTVFPYRQIVPHEKGDRVTRRGIRVHDIVLESPEQSLVWLFGHEFFHFLTWTYQTTRPDSEQQANLYGLELLNMYRQKI